MVNLRELCYPRNHVGKMPEDPVTPSTSFCLQLKQTAADREVMSLPVCSTTYKVLAMERCRVR